MRVAAIYDIHGNLPALEAVLHEIRESEVSHIVVGGDVLPGPMPYETLELLRSVDIPVQCIQGNGDREVLSQKAGIASATMPEPYREVMRWVGEQITPQHVEWIASWPQTLQIGVPAFGEVLFCHATPRNDMEIFTRHTNAERLAPVFADVDASMVVCGHTHMQFDRMVGAIRVVNAGSVGMPFGEPGAYWLLLGPDVTLRHTFYDLVGAAERIRNTAYPMAQEFAAQYVLEVPSEQQVLAAYANAELQ